MTVNGKSILHEMVSERERHRLKAHLTGGQKKCILESAL